MGANTGRSFWSTTAGVVTGAAGLATAVGGLLTAAIQLGWIGDSGNSSTTTTTVTTAVDAYSGTGTPGGGGRTLAVPEFSVEPADIKFNSLAAREETVTLRNTGETVIDVRAVEVDGTDSRQFQTSDSDCTADGLEPGRSCEIGVSFKPTGGGQFSAVLVIEVTGAPAEEVQLEGASLL